MFPLPREQIYSQNNIPRILCLISELCKYDDEPIFTLRDQKEGMESLQTLFINLTVNDPTEVTFAETVFGDVFYWVTVREIKALKDTLDKWREVASIKRKAIAYKAILDEVTSGGKSAFSAARYLIDEPNKNKRSPQVKAEVETTKAAARELYSADIANLKDYMDVKKGFAN
jgi:hypothetical protein